MCDSYYLPLLSYVESLSKFKLLLEYQDYDTVEQNRAEVCREYHLNLNMILWYASSNEENKSTIQILIRSTEHIQTPSVYFNTSVYFTILILN